MRLAYLLLFALAGAVLTSQTRTPPDDPDSGISETLARERAARVSNLRYDLTFTIPADRHAAVTGRETIAFTLSDAGSPLTIDFNPNQSGRVRRVDTGGAPVDVRQANGHLIVPAAVLRAGDNRVTIDFDAGDAPLNRNDDYLYTILVPARAHEAFPCFDQPDLKARWTLTLDVPADWETLGNGAELAREAHDGRTRLTFAETPPIPTYLFAFAAGRFSVERATRDGREMRMLHRETDAKKVARNRDAIFDLHAAALSWLERYTGLPYPFGKFDFLAVPAFQFGGMEHPGAIFYNASGLMLDETATQNQQLERASVISHETAHMWFGDLVTMRWFTDVWMKEVFANFLAAKIVNPSFPRINHDLRFLFAYYPPAYDVDRTEGTNAIRQPLANLNEAGTLYGNIIYDKAPIVMRQLETLVGADAFRDGLRDYLRRFAFANASWSDLIALLDDRTPEDLASWSRAWVDERARPIITTALTVENGRIARLALTQRDPYAKPRPDVEPDAAGRAGLRRPCPAPARSSVRARLWKSRRRGACRRRCSCCRTAAASLTEKSTSIRRAWRGSARSCRRFPAPSREAAPGRRSGTRCSTRRSLRTQSSTWPCAAFPARATSSTSSRCSPG